MKNPSNPIQIQSGGKLIEFSIFPENGEGSFIIVGEAEASEFDEACYQLQEGCSYEYEITDGYQINEIPGVVTHSKRRGSSGGRITPGNYTGTLLIEIVNEYGEIRELIPLEVRSKKTSYRHDYRLMLEDIAIECTELLMVHSSPVIQNFTYHPSEDPKTLYQQFSFVKSIINSNEFNEAIQRILSNPITRWLRTEEELDIRKLERVNYSIIRQIVTKPNRILLPEDHNLKEFMNTVPLRISNVIKNDTTDNIENQFIKYVLTVFNNFSSDVCERMNVNNREYREALYLQECLNNYLDHPLFKNMSQLYSLPLNNPVLQRKEGYREILRIWLLFDLAAKLIWKGGDDVYSAGKRDIAQLYEFWIFFKLLNLLSLIFKLDPKDIEKLIEPTAEGLDISIRSGKFVALEGIYDHDPRRLNIKFCYNRTFSGEKQYPESGSWALSMRPDYTLSIWPIDFSEEEAEKQELIIHIHFDAKYRVNNLEDIFGKDAQLFEEIEDTGRLEELKISHKREDLLKMHAYKDAIRRTAGAYVLYPGTESCRKIGFHEIIPGLGAFNIQPSKSDDGTNELRRFIEDVIVNYINRTSQRERISYHTHNVFKEVPKAPVKERMPENYMGDRVKPPEETSVIIGYCNLNQFTWIKDKKLYNFRIDERRGSIRLSPLVAGAEFILLHLEGQIVTNKIYRIQKLGPRVFSHEKMNSIPYYEHTDNSYLVYDIDTASIPEFENMSWDVSRITRYKPSHGSAFPFAVTLSELMKAKVS